MRLTRHIHASWLHHPGSLIICLAMAFWGFSASAQPDSSTCGSLKNGYGPYDYRVDHKQLPIVEEYHFTPEVEAVIRGKSGSLGSDLDYTLRAFPNHHRALMAMVKLGEKLKASQAPGAQYSVECYFERAIRFRSDDAIARMIYATFLQKTRRDRDASAQLEVATTLAGDNAFTHYNIGLIYFDGKKYDEALVQAHRAYGLGISRPELREQLIAAGKWVEP